MCTTFDAVMMFTDLTENSKFPGLINNATNI
jgi:hypothetical protein